MHHSTFKRNARAAGQAGCAALALLASSAQAQKTQWTNPGVGNWFVTGNWNGGVPQAGSVAEVFNGGLASITSPDAAAGLLYLGSSVGNGFIDVSGSGALTVNFEVYVSRGTLQIANGGKVLLLGIPYYGSQTYVGEDGYGHLGSAQLLVNGAGSYLRTGNLIMGGNSSSSSIGTLVIDSGGRVDSGSFDVKNGSVSVNGANSLISGTFGARIGAVNANNASLSVLNGGTANVGGAIAFYNGIIGVVGPGSSLNSSSHLYVGLASTGTLSVQGGGRVTSASGLVGSGSDLARGQASISGGGSAWVNSGQLRVGSNADDFSPVGSAGLGFVNVSAGGLLSSGSAILGNQAGYFGSVAVDGPNSRWTNSGDLVAGGRGIGEVKITGGAQLTSLRGHVGFEAGGNGSVEVSGAGSSWAATGSLFIGNGGNGVLQVLNSGVVGTAGNSYLGIGAGSVGQATVSGAGSTWNTLAAGTNLNIGGNQTTAGGNGLLSIEAGGTVNATATRLYSTGMLVLTDGGTLNGPLMADGGTVRTRGNTALAGAITLGAGGIAIQPVNAATVAMFGGNIDGTGGLRKSSFLGIGGGTVVLTGSNTYGGPTTVDIGRLLINGSNTSPVGVNAGVLGGSGTILAAVRVGDNSGVADAAIAPGAGPGALGTLTTGDLTINADGRYAIKIDSTAALADRIEVSGTVTLDPGATFSFNDLGASVLAPGTAFVVIGNDGVDPIIGRFAGLTEGQTVTAGANVYQVSYLAGTGNDLVLTTVPEPASMLLMLLGGVAVLRLARQRSAALSAP